jgi:hypothetical protein
MIHLALLATIIPPPWTGIAGEPVHERGHRGRARVRRRDRLRDEPNAKKKSFIHLFSILYFFFLMYFISPWEIYFRMIETTSCQACRHKGRYTKFFLIFFRSNRKPSEAPEVNDSNPAKKFIRQYPLPLSPRISAAF